MKLRTRCLSTAPWTLCAILLLLSAPASADDIDCSDLGGKVQGELNANLVVDRDCRVHRARVNGNVLFDGPYRLKVKHSEIDGNVECDGLGSVSLQKSEVTGDLDDCLGDGDDRANGKVEICHVPPGNPFAAHTIVVGAPAVPAHLAHGDYRGACGGDAPKNGHADFHARLEGLQEVPAVSTRGRGLFEATLDRDAEGLAYALRYDDLEGGAVRFAHIHLGARGTNGGVIAFLCSNVPPPAGVDTPPCPAQGETLEGTLVAADVVGPADQGIDPGEAAEALRALRAGATYVNVHTDGFPGGELRGQIAEGTLSGRDRKGFDD